MKWRFTNNNELMLEDVPGEMIPKKVRNIMGDLYSKNGEAEFKISLPDHDDDEESLEEELTTRGWRYTPEKTKTFDTDDGPREITYRPTIKVKLGQFATEIRRFTSKGSVNILEDPQLLRDFNTDDIESAAFLISSRYYDGDGLRTPYLKECRYKLKESPLDGLYEDSIEG